MSTTVLNAFGDMFSTGNTKLPAAPYTSTAHHAAMPAQVPGCGVNPVLRAAHYGHLDTAAGKGIRDAQVDASAAAGYEDGAVVKVE